MPVIEIVLAAVGISVGGDRAWRKFRGLPEEDEDAPEQDGRDQQSPSSPRPAPADAPGSDGKALHPFFSDAVALVSPRKRHTDAPDSPRASPGWQAHLSPRWSAGWGGGGDSGDPAGEDAALDSGALPWIRRVLGVQGMGAASAAGGSAEQAGGIDRMRQAIRALAGDNQRSSRSPPVRTNEESGGDWNPLRTPRSSALKKSGYGADSPMQSPRFTPGGRRRVRFDRKNLTNILYIHDDAAELESRRRRWALILQAAEREAFEAYVSSGKHRRREGSDDEASPRDDERSDLFQDHADASASSNWLSDTSEQAESSSGGIFGFMSGGGGGSEPVRTDERGVGQVRQNSRNWLSMPSEYAHDAGQFTLGAPEAHHASPNSNSLERASTRGHGGGANGFNGNESQRARGGAGADRPDGASPRGDAVSPRAQDTSSSPSHAQASISRRIFSDGSEGDGDGRSARDRQPGGGWERESGAQVEPGSSTSTRARDEGGSPQTGARAKAMVPKLNLASAGLAGGAGGLSPRSPRGAGERSAGGTRAYG